MTLQHGSPHRAKTKVSYDLTRDMLLADDAAVATHTQEELQSLVDRVTQACKDVSLSISLKKTNVLALDTEATPVVTSTVKLTSNQIRWGSSLNQQPETWEEKLLTEAVNMRPSRKDHSNPSDL